MENAIIKMQRDHWWPQEILLESRPTCTVVSGAGGTGSGCHRVMAAAPACDLNTVLGDQPHHQALGQFPPNTTSLITFV